LGIAEFELINLVGEAEGVELAELDLELGFELEFEVLIELRRPPSLPRFFGLGVPLAGIFEADVELLLV